jgi:Arc/MetJ family transcription regulator
MHSGQSIEMREQTQHPTTRTNIVLDTQLVEAALKLTGLKTRRELVDYALRELVRHERQTKLLELKGKIRWEGNLEAMRTGGHREDWG